MNCKIKDNSLNITVKTIEPTRINKLGRALVNIKQLYKKALNMPDRTRIVRVSNHLGMAGKKDLTNNILTEIRTYKNKQTIRVKTDIQQRFLKAI